MEKQQKHLAIFFVLFITTSFLSNNAKAQIFNFEKLRSSQDSVGVGGNIPFSFKSQERQVRLLEYSFAPNVAVFTQKHSYFALTSVHFVKTGDEKAESNGFAHLRMNLMREQQISYEIFAQIQYDEVRGMKQRYLSGAGLRFNLSDSSKFKMAIAIGLMYEKESWDFENQVAEKEFLKNTNYISLQFIPNKKIHFGFVGYWQARFDNFNAPRITGDLNFSYALSKKIALTYQILVSRDAAPVVPIEKTIYSLTAGLNFHF